jgi:hypothetical protein
VRHVRSLLAAKIFFVAVIGTVFTAEALLRGSRLNQCAIDREMLVAHESLRLHVNFGEEPLRYIAGQQSVAVFENTAWFHTASSMPRPTNYRNNRLQSICSTSNRPERTEQKTCNNKASRMYSGEIEGRPKSAFSASNSWLSDPGTASVSLRTARSG